ncbi:MAG: SusC/RagA family TonB-linked outer membrane protein [Bacteroidota bacterium]
MMDHYFKWFNRTKRLVSAKNSLKAMFFAVTILVSSSLYAQEAMVSGKITDASDGTGIPGTSIAIKGTTKGVVTDVNGAFKISVPAGATLVISSVGYLTQQIVVGNKTEIDVALATDAKTIEEVIVVGYGTQKRKEISGTVTSLGSKEFNAGVVTNPLQAAQGKVAGLVITQSSGDPNSRPTVRLRGTGSLSGSSEPLYVIDGVIGAPIENIAPDDILTMDVLRDASSAAIYGSRGANGVILINTKRGKSGVPTVDYNGFVGMETIAQRPELMNGSQFREAAKKYNATFTDLGANTDWLDVITRTARSQSHNVGISGGGENSSYRVSVGYLDQIGTLLGSGKDRVNARLNMDSKALNGKLNVRYNFAISQSKGDIARDVALGLAYNMRPTDPVYNTDGTYFQLPGTFSNFNPLARIEKNNRQEKILDMLGNIQATYSLTKDLNFKVSGTLRTQGKDINEYIASTPGNILQVPGGNAGQRIYNDENDQQLETTLNYVKSLSPSSNFSLLGGYGYQEVVNSGFGAVNRNFLTDDLGSNSLGSGIGILQLNAGLFSYKNAYKLISFFGRGTYSLNDKYFATVNLRRDGSTKFGTNNKWGIFPSASIRWAINKEDFLKNVQIIDNMAIRVGWGRTGNSNDITPLQARSTWGVNGTYYDPNTDSNLPSYGIQSNTNPNLKWEVNENYGVGVDFSLSKGKLAGSLDFYTRSTKDLLYRVNAPQEAGFVFPTILANVGSIRNRGLETTLTYQFVANKDFDWSATLAASFNKNEVTAIGNAQFPAAKNIFLTTNLGSFLRGTSAVDFSVLEVGKPVGVFYGGVVESVTDQGKYVFKDINGDGKVEPSGLDRDYLGDPNPFFVGGLTNQLKFKGFDAMFQLLGNFGSKIMNTNELLYARQDARIAESNALIGALTSKINDERTIPMSYYVESGNFVRLNNASIGYTLPNAVGLMRRARIYVAGNNLALFTKYKGVDPEVSQALKVDGDNRRAPGIDVKETYYKTRGFTLGVNLSF